MITVLSVVLVIIVTGFVWPVRKRHETKASATTAHSNAVSMSGMAAATIPHATSAPAADFRPLPVAQKSAKHEWTAGDASTPAIIEKLAHNPDEFIRMVEENERIKRRQLVYRMETVPMLLERGRSAEGQTLRSFTLPALDGREVEVEVTEIHEEPSLHGGSVIGRVKGRFNSMVSVGFVNGYESFNVFSPDDGLFLTADAREPGQVIVKEIDPDKYTPTTGNEPDFILTHESLPKTHDR